MTNFRLRTLAQHLAFFNDKAQAVHAMRSKEMTKKYADYKIMNMLDALEACDWQKFLCELGGLLHTMQDSYSHGYMDKPQHYFIGYSGEVLYSVPFLSVLAGAIGWINPDNPHSNSKKYSQAKAATLGFLREMFQWVADHYPDKKAKHTGKPGYVSGGDPDPTPMDPRYCYWHIDIAENRSQDGGDAHLATFGFGLRNGRLSSPSSEGMTGISGMTAPWSGDVHIVTPAIGGFGGLGLGRGETSGLLTDILFLPAYRFDPLIGSLPTESYSRDAWETNTQDV